MPNQIICGDCVDEMKKIPDESVDLIIADPPYWKVINEKWDYQWRTEQDYLVWSESWVEQASRILRKGGTMHLFGYFRILALLLPTLEKNLFEVRQQLVIDKGIKAVAGRATRDYKLFPNVVESVLFLIKDSKKFIKELLKKKQKELNLTSKKINELLGVKANGGGMWSIYAGDNVCEQIPTKEMWEKLQTILRIDIPYETISQTFNPMMGLSNVWNDIDFYHEKRYHPTQKPIKLIERLVQASSNENDFIVDPFAGSGTTALACLKLKRRFLLIEKEKKYCEIIEKRISQFSK